MSLRSIAKDPRKISIIAIVIIFLALIDVLASRSGYNITLRKL